MSRMTPILGCVALAATALSARAQVTITEFPVTTAGSRPYTIVAGADGNLWFTESVGNKLGRITPQGVITEFPVPTAASGPYGIALAPDGDIWFTERFADQIGRFRPSTGQFVDEYPLPTAFAQPWEIATGPDGRMWFTEEDVAQIGRISSAGGVFEFSNIGCCFPTGIAAGADGNLWYSLEIGDWIGKLTPPSGPSTTYAIPSVQVLAWDITPGPDGNVWFTELAGRAVGRITPTGTVTEFPIAGNFSGIAGISAGPDGNLWFTENDTFRISVMNTAGQVLNSWDTGDRPLSITIGPDGNLWFTEADANAIGRVNLAQSGTAHVLSTDAAFTPKNRKIALGDSVQWTFLGPNRHRVQDASGLGLFGSNLKRIVSYYTAQFPIAGTFDYSDSQSTNTGKILVPIDVPNSGTTGVGFTVTWSTQPLPPGTVYQSQVLAPGSSSFVVLTNGTATSTVFVPPTSGSYFFRGRLRNPTSGAAAGFSPTVRVTVF